MTLQMHAISTNAPFFKQPVPTQSSSFFLSQDQSQQQHSQSYLSNMRKQKETQVSREMEQQSGDRLSALHTRLQIEAEKIRKWKNATEAEIKEKNKKLKDANATIESQRKSVTELQLKKESLSSRLRDEVSNQKEIQQKICSTRDMCTALKNHAVRLDDAICKGEQDRDLLTQLHQEKVDKYQGLIARFHELESGQREWMDSQAQLMVEEKKVSAHLRAHCQSLEQQLKETSKEVSLLKELNMEKVELTQSLARELKEKSALFVDLSQEKDSLSDDLSTKEGDVRRLENELEILQGQLVTTQDELKQKEADMNDLQETIEQTKVSHAEQMTTVQSSLSTYQLKCEQMEGLNSDLELTLTEITSRFTGDIESLKTQLEHTKQELTLAQEESLALRKSLSSEVELVSQLKGEKLSLKDQLAEALIDSEKLSLRMHNELKLKNDTVSNLEDQLEKSSSDHQEKLAEWATVQSKLEAQIAELERQKSGLCENVESLDEGVNQTRAQVTELQSRLIETVEADEKAISGLVHEKQKAYDEISSLKKKITSLTNEKDELLKECTEMEPLKTENTNLNNSVQSEKALVGKLQKELEVIQSDMALKSGELSGLVDKSRKDAESAQEECAQVRQSLGTQLTELQAKLESTSSELSAQVEKYKIEAKNAKEEHEQTKSSFNEQTSELYSILGNYRTEYQNIMSQKDREIESLREQIKQNESDKRASETELSSCKDKVELLQSDLSAKTHEMKELLEAVECLQNKAKVSATPRKPSVDLMTPVHSTINQDTDEPIVSCTPKLRGFKKLASTVSTPRDTPHRMYNYRSSTPLSKSSRQLHTNTQHSGNKAKRMRYREDIESEEMRKFKELYPDHQLEDDESMFKKPKTKGVTVRKASSTANTKYSLSNTKYPIRPPLASHNRRHRKSVSEGKQKSEDLSWFDSDSVFGLGIDD